MKLLVDNREPRALIELLTVRVQNIEVVKLDIGDFIIKTDNGETVMIFERKSLADLIASIKDGRYNEQSFRLSNLSLNNHHIYYVIEGDIGKYIHDNSEPMRKTLFSAMLSLSYKKDFSLLRTVGWLETAEFIIRFMEKLATEKITQPKEIDVNVNVKETKVESGNTEKNYSDVVKITKKSNITRENIGEIMLAQIPGISISSAQSLMIEYKTIKNLITVLENDKECLDNFKIECKNGARKISKTTVKNLKDFLDI